MPNAFYCERCVDAHENWAVTKLSFRARNTVWRSMRKSFTGPIHFCCICRHERVIEQPEGWSRFVGRMWLIAQRYLVVRPGRKSGLWLICFLFAAKRLGYFISSNLNWRDVLRIRGNALTFDRCAYIANVDSQDKRRWSRLKIDVNYDLTKNIRCKETLTLKQLIRTKIRSAFTPLFIPFF